MKKQQIQKPISKDGFNMNIGSGHEDISQIGHDLYRIRAYADILLRIEREVKATHDRKSVYQGTELANRLSDLADMMYEIRRALMWDHDLDTEKISQIEKECISKKY